MVTFLSVSNSDSTDGMDSRVNSVCYSRCGNYTYCTTNDGVLGLYDAHTGNRLSEFHMKEAGCRLVTATHHPMGVLHASGLPGFAGSKRDPPLDANKALDSGQIVYHNLHENKIMRVFRGHKDRVTSISMNPANDLFLTTSLDGTFRVWDLRSSVPLAMGPLASSTVEEMASADGATSTPKAKSSGDVLEARGNFDTTGRVFAIAVSMPDEKDAPLSFTMYNSDLIGETLEGGRCFFPSKSLYETGDPKRVGEKNAFHPLRRLSFKEVRDGHLLFFFAPARHLLVLYVAQKNHAPSPPSSCFTFFSCSLATRT